MPALSEATPQRGAPVAVCLKLETRASSRDIEGISKLPHIKSAVLKVVQISHYYPWPQESEVSVSLTDDCCDDKLEDGALNQSEGASVQW